MADTFGRLSQLLALLLSEVLELANLHRQTFQELVDLVDVVPLQADLKGDGVDGVKRRVCVVGCPLRHPTALDFTQ